MKGAYSSAAFTGAAGVQVASLAQIEVRREDTGVLATIYADKDGITLLANPFIADAFGRFIFFATGLDLGYQVKATAGDGSQSIARFQPLGNARYFDTENFPYEPLDAQLSAIAALTPANRQLMAWTSLTTVELLQLQVFMRTFLIAATQAAARDAIQLGTGDTPSFTQVAVAGDPGSALQVATKQYVDSVSAGLDIKPSVRGATTVNDTLSGLAARDGVTPLATERWLVKNQTAPAENGVYVAAAGAWTRATDMDNWLEVPGAFVFVEEGSTLADTGWVCTANKGGTLNTTAITWSQFAGVGTFQPLDAELTALASLTSAADKVPYFTGSGTAAVADFPASGRSLVAVTAAADKLPYFTSGSAAAVADLPASGRSLIAVTAAADKFPYFTSGSAAAVADITSGARTLLSKSNADIEHIAIACSDETTALTAGTNKVKFRMPYAFSLTSVRASLSTAQTSGSIFTVDINEAGTTVISTKLTIDNTELTSTTAATAAVISDAALADDAEISVDIDQIGDGTAKGLKVYLIGRKA